MQREKKYIKTRNRSTTSNAVAMGVVMFFVFISFQCFAQSTIKQTDSTNSSSNTNVAFSKDFTTASFYSDTSKTSDNIVRKKATLVDANISVTLHRMDNIDDRGANESSDNDDKIIIQNDSNNTDGTKNK